MKRLAALSCGIIILACTLIAQTTSYDTDFTSGHPFVSVYDWANGEISADIDGGEMKVSYNKSDTALWNRLVFWVKPFDIGVAPHCKFNIKGDKAFQMNLDFKDETAAAVTKSFDVTTEYQEIVLDLSEDIPALGSTLLDELQWDVGFSNDSGTFWLDDFKMGTAATPPGGDTTGGDTLTAFMEDFNEGIVPSNWKEAPSYTLSNVDNALVIDVDKGTNESSNKFFVELGNIFDFSAATFLSFDAKVSTSTQIYFLFYDNQGQVTRADHRILEGGILTPIFVDFGGFDRIDYTAITKMAINVALNSFNYQGVVTIDNLKMGTSVSPFSSILTQQDLYFEKNEKGATILITDIENAGSVEITGAESLIENISSAAVESGTATVSFDCIDDSAGEDSITIHTKGLDGFLDGALKTRLVVEENHPPALEQVPDMYVDLSDSLVLIRFYGLKDNNIATDQEFQVEVTSLDESVLEISSLEYESPMPDGMITLNLLRTGLAQVVISVIEDTPDNGTVTDTFQVNVVDGLNHPPTLDYPDIVKRFIGKETDTIIFSGLTDGDDGLQNLSFGITSSDSSVVLPVSMHALGSDSAMLILEALDLGTVSIGLTITDDGGSPGNNGDMSFTVSFILNILTPPVRGYVADFSNVEADVARGLWTFGNIYELSTVDSSAHGFYAMRIDATDKFYWDGYNLNFRTEGFELDLSEHPYFSMEIYPLDDNTLHWLWFYDYSDTLRNTQNNRSEDKLARAESGKWNPFFFDFSGALDWRNEDYGKDIDPSRIVRILFDMHNADFAWPPPSNYSGSFLIRNLRLGSEALSESQAVKPSINTPVIPMLLENSGQHRVELTGIHDGTGSVEGLILLVESSDETVIEIMESDPVAGDGTSAFTLNALKVGLSKITFTLSGGNSEEELVIEQWARIISDEYSYASTVVIDESKRFQTIRGFGTYMDSRNSDLYLNEMNASAVRIGIIGNQIEWKNDNNNPHVLNMEGFDYGAFDWDYFRRLNEGGVESFILTSWSPPAWMKDNLSLSHFKAAQSSYTDQVENRLSYHYYEEFAEEMVAVVRMFREKAGIDLTGIGLQNEPAFHEPYPSAILDPSHFNELIRVVGKRFEQEGIETMLYMPEQVFTQDANSMKDYIDALQSDEEANRICPVIATHGYAANGIAVASPDFSAWAEMWDNAIEGSNPKELWMTETHLAYSQFKDAIFIAGAIQGALIAGNTSLWTQWSFKDQFTTNGQPNSMLYAVRNFARYVRPGAERMGATSSEDALLVSAFMHPETSAVSIVLVNTGTNNLSVDLSAANLPHLYETYQTTSNANCSYIGLSDVSDLLALPALSVTTLYTIEESALTMDRIGDLVVEENSGQQIALVTGISDGTGGVTGLSVSLETDNPALITNLSAGSVTTEGTCQISFVPGADLTGTGKITVTLSDESYSQVETFYVQVTEKQSVDLEESMLGTGLEIFPNPASQSLNIHCREEIVSCQIIGITGQVLDTQNISHANISEVKTDRLEPGIYYLKVCTIKNQALYRSFVKQ